MIKLSAKFAFIAVIMMAVNARGISQTAIPEVLFNGTLPEQMKYLEEKTRIYEDYRAIREDMFQLIKKNAIDSLGKIKGQVTILAGMNRNLVVRIDSLSTSLSNTEAQLNEAVTTKNSIKVVGINVNKVAYNSIMWIIVAGLAVLLAVGFLIFKRNVFVTQNTKKELADLSTEFEEYRQKTRLEREKMSMDHFNEIKRLKGR
jgi:hypothetical protein